jgi:HlyD family secretion protein
MDLKQRFIISAFFLLIACDTEKKDRFDGYAEGEFVYIAPTTSGILEKLYVKKGQKILSGEKFFMMDRTNLQAVRDMAISKYDNLVKGKRPEEINIIAKQKEQAEANLTNAKRSHERCLELIKTHAVSRSDLDEKTAVCRSLEARVQELSSALNVARTGARSDEIRAANQEIIQANHNLSQATPKALQNGMIEDIYYHPGEFVTAGSPVISFLPFDNIKIRFFVPQKMLPEIGLHQKVQIVFDDDGSSADAEITFISPKAEFTPPVIYSIESRKKLVFMAEATPKKFDERLRPGLPVSVLLVKNQ